MLLRKSGRGGVQWRSRRRTIPPPWAGDDDVEAALAGLLRMTLGLRTLALSWLQQLSRQKERFSSPARRCEYKPCHNLNDDDNHERKEQQKRSKKEMKRKENEGARKELWREDRKRKKSNDKKEKTTGQHLEQREEIQLEKWGVRRRSRRGGRQGQGGSGTAQFGEHAT